MLFLQTIIRTLETESRTNSALQCIECFIGPPSYFLGLFDIRTVRCWDIDMDQCKVLSQTSTKNISFFLLEMYLWLETIESQVDQFFITLHHLYKIRWSLLSHFQYYRPLWIMTFTCADSSNTLFSFFIRTHFIRTSKLRLGKK